MQKLDKEGNVVSNYAKKNMKTDANGILSLKVGNQWVHTFITNADNRLSVPGGYLAGSSEAKGSVALPLNLPSGDYRLKEVVAPKGYVLADDGRFTITKSSISGVDEDGQPVLTMVATDVQQKENYALKRSGKMVIKAIDKQLLCFLPNKISLIQRMEKSFIKKVKSLESIHWVTMMKS